MKEPHRKGLASHPDPESCAGLSNVAREALTGAHVDQPSSCEINRPGCRRCYLSGRQYRRARHASAPRTLRSRRPCVCVETPCTDPGRSHECPLTLFGPAGEGNAPYARHVRSWEV